MTYVPKNWNDFAAGGTPLNSTAMNDFDTRVATGFSALSTAVTALSYDTTGATGASSALQALIDSGVRTIFIPPGLFNCDAAVFYDTQDGNSTLRIMANGVVFVAQTTLPTVAEWDTFATGRSVATGCKFFLFPSTARTALSGGVVTLTGNNIAGTATYPVQPRNGMPPQLIIDGGTFTASLLTNSNGGFVFSNIGGAVELRSVHMNHARMLCCSKGYVDNMKMINCNAWESGTFSATNDAAMFYQIDSGDGVYIYGCKTAGYILASNLTSCNGAHIAACIAPHQFTNCPGIKIDANHQETATNISNCPRIIYDIKDSHVTIDTSFDYMPENQTGLGAIYINDSGGEGQQSTVDIRNYFGRYFNLATDSTSGYALYLNKFNDRSQINVYFSGMQMSRSGSLVTAYAQYGLLISGDPTNEPTLAAAVVTGRDLIGSGSFQIYKYATVSGQSGQNAAMTIGIGQIGNLAGLYRGAAHVLPTKYDNEAYGLGTLTNGTVYAYAAAVCNTLPDGSIQYGTATAEWTQTATAIGAQGFEMYMPSAGNGATLVIWRKTATGVLASPDRYIAIPVGTCASRFLDTGVNINGMPWITTSVPVPNTVAAANHTREALYQGQQIVSPILKAGAPLDADWSVAPANGTMVFDTTNSFIYVRFGGTWKKTAALT